MCFRWMTRVFVLGGAVGFVTAMSGLLITSGELLAEEPEEAATNQVVQGNSTFAIDLYQQLVEENEGKNLFFSPFSISGALSMTAEGAQSETAQQMGQVLRFPKAARRAGEDAKLLPWDTSLIHTGMGAINRKLNRAQAETDEKKVIRLRIAELRKELGIAKQRTSQLMQARKWQAIAAARQKEKTLADELNKLAAKVDQFDIRVANALWGEKTYPFRQEFIDTVDKHYETGGVFPVDFRTQSEAARLRINGWVEEQTNERIKDLIPAGALDHDTRLVLTNAIYFKGQWSAPFDSKLTKEKAFTLADGSKVKTPLMTQRSHKAARYAAFNADGSFFKTPTMITHGGKTGLYPDADGFAMVELPYKGDALSMIVIAPNDPAGLSRLESKLTSEDLTTWISQLVQRKTHVHLPKFELETSYTLGSGGRVPSGTLPMMGMVRAFTDPRDPKQGAQFDSMCASADPAYRLYISKVLHKAFVEVNEEGTEAAAATAVVMETPLSAPVSMPFTPTFKADRPFLYLIRDNASGSILFLGRLTDPTT